MTTSSLSIAEEDPWWRARNEDTKMVVKINQSITAATTIIEENTSPLLDLSYRCIGSDGLQQFVRKLGLNRTLTKIDLTCNLLEEEGAISLFKAITRNTVLQKVNVAGNTIGPLGGKAFADCIMVNNTLEKVSFFHNELGDVGASHIADALKHNKSLHSLNLRENRITDEGAEELLKAIHFEQNPTLNILWLSNNIPQHIAAEVGASLPDTLRTKLKLLSQVEGLHYNDISQSVTDKIKRSLIEKLPIPDENVKRKPDKKKKNERESEADKMFWTPPETPDVTDVDDAEKENAKKKKK